MLTITEMKSLPTSMSETALILFEREILICGCFCFSICYSYHEIKKDYKPFAKYPLQPLGHFVVSCLNAENETILISFGGGRSEEDKHMLFLKYRSVWNENENENENEEKESNLLKWSKINPFTNTQPSEVIHFGLRSRGIVIQNDKNENILIITGGSESQQGAFAFNINLNRFISKRWNSLPEICDGGWNSHAMVSLSNCEFVIYLQDGCYLMRYDSSAKLESQFTFTRLPNNPFHPKLESFGYSFVMERYLIILCGSHHQNAINIINKISIFDIKTKEWFKTKGKEWDFPCFISSCTAISMENEDIHLFGGLDNKREVNTHFKLDLFNFAKVHELVKQKYC